MSHGETSSLATPATRRPVAVARLVAILGSGILGWLAVLVGLEGPDANPWLVVLDVSVGIVFIGSALVAPGPWRMRLLVGVVGLAWLFGPLVGIPGVAHQGALLVALVAFPTGRISGVPGSVLAAVAVPLVFGIVPQGIAALAFAAVAALRAGRRHSAGDAYPFAAAAAVSVALGLAWLTRTLDPFGYDPVVAGVAYAVVLVLAGFGFPIAMRAIEDRSAIQAHLLRGEGLSGLAGLESVLADSLGDRSMRLYAWEPISGTYVDARGNPAKPDTRPGWLAIEDATGPLGGVAHRSGALDDDRTAAAVADALRLALENLRRQAGAQRQLAELEAARVRLLATVDRERATIADRLQADVVMRVSEAAAALREAPIGLRDADASEAMAVAIGELDGVGVELMRLVDGLGPSGVGDGGLERVLRDVASRSPLDVEIVAEPDAIDDVGAETALAYVCLEAMANAAKHASARTLRISIRRRGGFLEAVVADDGIGAADPDGAGLRGLADRLAAHGGRLRVESPPGAGTTVTAAVPLSRSSATPSA